MSSVRGKRSGTVDCRSNTNILTVHILIGIPVSARVCGRRFRVLFAIRQIRDGCKVVVAIIFRWVTGCSCGIVLDRGLLQLKTNVPHGQFCHQIATIVRDVVDDHIGKNHDHKDVLHATQTPIQNGYYHGCFVRHSLVARVGIVAAGRHCEVTTVEEKITTLIQLFLHNQQE